MKDLQQLRTEIDKVDKEIIGLLSTRIELVKQVGQYKKMNNLPVVDMNRWQAVLEEKINIAKELNLDEQFVTDIYNKIHEFAISLEKRQ